MDYSKDSIKCPYDFNKIVKSAHRRENFDPVPKKIYNNALEAIGLTPMIRL